MDAAAQLDAIVETFERLGIEVRKEQLGGGGGGLCRLRDRRVLFIDLDADAATQLDRSVAALAKVPEVDALYLSPELRERIDACRRTEA
jgi:hypothetical protein